MAAIKEILLGLVFASVLAATFQCIYGDYFREPDPDSFVGQFLIPQNEARANVGLAPLQWDNRLAQYAQWWANQRAAYGNCLLRHSGGPYGENVFWGSGKAWGPADAVSAWVDERQWYNYYTNSCSYFQDCGHYTQIVWRTSTRVGCAKSTCSDGDVFMTCNYYPPGNYIGQRPY
ncbi:hypothetical protein O6H91_04G064000 [Diphasiastrum complanatum]|uniref:Uncharacterized protein n=1 Tax=Diphasiastrum complanatum TaxID=34168 RepID=A0ACC2DXK5_DIPCM|nr:hypothetical protein O6H91_04G064000 [Diphasiastrum complanatum]